MAKIEQLTPEEEALIPIVREEWIKIGLATGPADREAAQAAIADAYRQAGLAPPKHWIWLGSPWAGCIGAWMLTQLPITTNPARAQVRDHVGAQVWDQIREQVEAQVGHQVYEPVREQVGDQVGHQVYERVRAQVGAQVRAHVRDQVYHQVREQVREQVRVQVGAQVWDQDQVGYQVWQQTWIAGHGQHDADWLAHYDMFRRMKRVNGPERLEPLIHLATAAGWWWPFAEACIITERPTVLYRDEARRLHCGDGPALAYPDGWAIHAWHGRRIPAWLVEDKARITPDAIEAETNAELRRVMLEIFGFDR